MRIIYIVLSFILVSCTVNEFSPDEWAIDPILELSSYGVALDSMDDFYSFTYVTNYKEVSVSTNQADWVLCHLDKTSKTINLEISPNMSVEQRIAVVDVTISRGLKSLSRAFTVYQTGGKWDVVEGTNINLRWSHDVSDSQKGIIKQLIHDMVFVEGGTFWMGTQSEDADKDNYFPYKNAANPLHQVTLSDFYIGKYEITQEQWIAVMGTRPSCFQGGYKPVEGIRWNDAMEYVTRLSNLTGLSFSLPTSAQWEYAARGGKYTMGYYYPGGDDYRKVAHVISALTPIDSPLYTTYEVGLLSPNELGLYDMAGNVSEMCYDWYGTVPTEPQTDPTGPNSGEYHVCRGGDFTDESLILLDGNCGYPGKFIETDSSVAGIRLVLKY